MNLALLVLMLPTQTAFAAEPLVPPGGVFGGWLIAAALLGGVGGAVWHQRAARGNAARERDSLEARVAGLVESAMDPIVTVDASQTIVAFNAAAERVFQWPRAEVIGKPLGVLLPPRFHAAHRDHVEQFGRTGVTSRRMGAQKVLTALRADGVEFPIEASISQHRDAQGRLFTVILRDVTERVHAEAMLLRSEARLRGILDSAMDAIITIDERHDIVLFNAAAEAMFGCSREEALGTSIDQFIPERFRAAHAHHVRRFGEGSTLSRRMGEERIVTGVRRSGEEFPIDASISQATESNAKFYTVILRDVTQRVRAEAEIHRSREELRELGTAAHLTREHEKTRMARELHDELGGALTMLQMDVAWCRERMSADPRGCEAKLERMERLLKSTSAAARRIAADLRPLMLDDLGLPDALEWLVQDFTARTGVACRLTIDPALPSLQSMQSTAIFRIVQESLSNIAKHAQASHADVEISQDAQRMTIAVRDDGIGFATDAARKPASFGLLGVRERASLLNGEARIASAIGAGTSVEVTIPLQGMAS